MIRHTVGPSTGDINHIRGARSTGDSLLGGVGVNLEGSVWPPDRLPDFFWANADARIAFRCFLVLLGIWGGRGGNNGKSDAGPLGASNKNKVRFFHVSDRQRLLRMLLDALTIRNRDCLEGKIG